jgi:hypothetical protein
MRSGAESALAEVLRSIDVFQSVPRDHANAGGAIWTGRLFFIALGYALVGLLSFTEITTFSDVTWTTDTVVSSQMDTSMSVQFNLSFPSVACKYLRLGSRDRFGMQEVVPLGDRIHFTPLNQDEAEHHKQHMFQGDDALAQMYEADDDFEDEPVRLSTDDALPSSDVFLHNNLTDAVSFSDFTLVFFYADWCEHSRKFHRSWNRLTQLAKGKNDTLHFPDEEGRQAPITLLRMNCVDFKDTCRDIDIKMFPTLRLYRRDGIFAPFQHGKRTLNHVLDFLGDSLRSARFMDAEHQPVSKEGCQVVGLFNVARVQGFFQISAEASNESSLNPDLVNMSHRVEHLSFGDTEATFLTWQRMEGLREAGVPSSILDHFHPLDDQQFTVDQASQFPEHHLKVVTTKIGKRKDLYQITHTARVVDSAGAARGRARAIAQARFSYDFSPLTVVLKKVSKPWYEFVTSLIAILGGTYTVVQLCGGAADRVHIAMHKAPVKYL